MKIAIALLSFFFSTTVFAQALDMSSLIGEHKGMDQLRRPCVVEVTGDLSDMTFVATAFDGSSQTYSHASADELQQAIASDRKFRQAEDPNYAPQIANANIGRHTGFVFPIFGNHADNSELSIQWNSGELDSIWLEQMEDSGPMVMSHETIACFL